MNTAILVLYLAVGPGQVSVVKIRMPDMETCEVQRKDAQAPTSTTKLVYSECVMRGKVKTS